MYSAVLLPAPLGLPSSTLTSETLVCPPTGVKPTYRKALRKRSVWVEPLFAEAKDWHGARRFRLRALEKVNAEALLIASGQNVKRLLTFGHRGPRRPAQVAALRQPVPSPYKFRCARRHHKRCSGRPARVFQHAVLLSEGR